MIEEHFENVVRQKLGFEFSSSQRRAMDGFVSFFFGRNADSLFLLKGFAGTGKTSLVAAVVGALVQFRVPVVLLAPTGRAAKVFAGYSGHAALTIHKKIYRQRAEREGVGYFDLGFNPAARALFFVDEASMISLNSPDSTFGSGCLLDDLFTFVYNGRGNRLVLIGDVAQLPPVGTELSPALDADFLRASYGVEVFEAALTDVMRQSEQSGILHNATLVRGMIGGGPLARLLLSLSPFPDIARVSGADLLETLDDCYSRFGVDETMVVCRSNKRANRFNAGIRARVLYREEQLTGGDRVMIVKNNYFWGAEADKDDFIANGDTATVRRVGRHRDLYGFHFAEVTLELFGREGELTVQVLLDTLASEQPALGYDDARRLYFAVEEDYADIAARKKRQEKVRQNEFFNALQIKFAYAVTCHKAQGGQWDAVFVDPGWVDDSARDDEYWRWLYTAFTRARRRLYLVNFKDDWFAEP